MEEALPPGGRRLEGDGVLPSPVPQRPVGEAVPEGGPDAALGAERVRGPQVQVDGVLDGLAGVGRPGEAAELAQGPPAALAGLGLLPVVVLAVEEVLGGGLVGDLLVELPQAHGELVACGGKERL